MRPAEQLGYGVQDKLYCHARLWQQSLHRHIPLQLWSQIRDHPLSRKREIS
jgi:hypothetical protein